MCKIVEVSTYAPNPVNSQSWHFAVVCNKAVLTMFLRCTYASFAKASNVTIVVCLEPAIEKAPGYWVQGCSATTENMFLAAHTLSYGHLVRRLPPRKSASSLSTGSLVSLRTSFPWTLSPLSSLKSSLPSLRGSVRTTPTWTNGKTKTKMGC